MIQIVVYKLMLLKLLIDVVVVVDVVAVVTKFLSEKCILR
jgi:hypothetical protein